MAPRVVTAATSISHTRPVSSGTETWAVQPSDSTKGSPLSHTSSSTPGLRSPPKAGVAAASTSISNTRPNPSGSPTCPAQPPTPSEASPVSLSAQSPSLPYYPLSPVSLSEFPILQLSSSWRSPESNCVAAASTSILKTCTDSSASQTCPAQVPAVALSASPSTPPTRAASRAPERSTSPSRSPSPIPPIRPASPPSESPSAPMPSTSPPKTHLPPSQTPPAQRSRSPSPCSESEDDLEPGPNAFGHTVRCVEYWWNGHCSKFCCCCPELAPAWNRSLRVCGMPLCPSCMY